MPAIAGAMVCIVLTGIRLITRASTPSDVRDTVPSGASPATIRDTATASCPRVCSTWGSWFCAYATNFDTPPEDDAHFSSAAEPRTRSSLTATNNGSKDRNRFTSVRPTFPPICPSCVENRPISRFSPGISGCSDPTADLNPPSTPPAAVCSSWDRLSFRVLTASENCTPVGVPAFISFWMPLIASTATPPAAATPRSPVLAAAIGMRAGANAAAAKRSPEVDFFAVPESRSSFRFASSNPSAFATARTSNCTRRAISAARFELRRDDVDRLHKLVADLRRRRFLSVGEPARLDGRRRPLPLPVPIHGVPDLAFVHALQVVAAASDDPHAGAFAGRAGADTELRRRDPLSQPATLRQTLQRAPPGRVLQRPSAALHRPTQLPLQVLIAGGLEGAAEAGEFVRAPGGHGDVHSRRHDSSPLVHVINDSARRLKLLDGQLVQVPRWDVEHLRDG